MTKPIVKIEKLEKHYNNDNYSEYDINEMGDKINEIIEALNET